jgi:hypothetical protein
MSKVFESLVNGSLLDPVGGNNGTLTAGASRGFIQTDKGLALEFDGSATKFVVGDDDALDFGTSDFSLEFILRLNDLTADRALMVKYNSINNPGFKLEYITATSNLKITFGGASAHPVIATSTLKSGIFYHCIFLADRSGNGKWIINNLLSGSEVDISGAATITNALDLNIGNVFGTSTYYDGLLKDIKFYNNLLTTKEQNNGFIDFLTAGNSFAQKRGFFVQKPTDLSRHTDDGLVAAYNMTLDEDGTGADLVGNALDITFSGGFLPTDNGIRFHGVDGKGVVGNVGNTKSMSFRIKLDSTTEKILEGAANDKLIHASSGTMTYPEFDNAFIDGIDSNAITAGQWTNVVIVSSTNVDMSAVTIALNNATYGDFEMADLRFYSTQLTLANAITLHNSFILPTLVETFDEGASGVAKLPQDWISGTGTYKISQVNQSDTLPAFPDGIKLYDKYLECTVAGTIATLSTQAFGTYEFDFYKGTDGSDLIVYFISDNPTLGTENGYRFLFQNNEAVQIVLKTNGTTVPNKLVSATSYLNNTQWYHFKLTRTKAGTFTLWIDGILVVTNQGSNPFTDLTHVVSNYSFLSLIAGDRVANFNYKDEIEQ